MNRTEHWNHVYQTKASDDVSWFQAQPATSLRLIEACGVARLDLLGFSPMVNSAEHLRWFESQGGRISDDERIFERPASRKHPGTLRFVSLDLDVIDASSAPGVSAMNPCGMSARKVEKLVYAAGCDARVACFDIMELSPRHDHMNRTARLAAHLFLTFLRGLAERWTAGAAE